MDVFFREISIQVPCLLIGFIYLFCYWAIWFSYIFGYQSLNKGIVYKEQRVKVTKWWFSHSVTPDSLRPHGLQPARLLCPWDSPGKNTGVACHCCLQGIFLTQGSNPVLLHYRQILYSLIHKGSSAWSTRVFCSLALHLFTLLNVSFSISVIQFYRWCFCCLCYDVKFKAALSDQCQGYFPLRFPLRVLCFPLEVVCLYLSR